MSKVNSQTYSGAYREGHGASLRASAKIDSLCTRDGMSCVPIVLPDLGGSTIRHTTHFSLVIKSVYHTSGDGLVYLTDLHES